MKKILLIFIIINSTIIIFSQEKKTNDEWLYEDLYEGKQVFVNKKVTAFTVYSSKTTNGIEKSGLITNPDINNPFEIYINSDNDKSSIRINNKHLKEDLYFEFKKIYKVEKIFTNGYDFFYAFIGDDCDVSYYVPKKNSVDHQELIIYCENDEKNSTTLIFTISKLHQL